VGTYRACGEGTFLKIVPLYAPLKTIAICAFGTGVRCHGPARVSGPSLVSTIEQLKLKRKEGIKND
jgi:hypothetical protein